MAEMTDCFLSHDWSTPGNHDRVVAVARELSERKGLTCWIDDNNMKGNVLISIMDGITNASCMVLFITKKYLEKIKSEDDNDNCYLEFKFALAEKKRIQTVVMEDLGSYSDTSTWPRLMLLKSVNDILYVDMSRDFSDSAYIQRKIDKLSELIVSNISRSSGHTSAKVSPYLTSTDPIAKCNDFFDQVYNLITTNIPLVPVSNSKASPANTTATEITNPIAQFNMGEMFDNGTGVFIDKHEAFQWYKKAANQGYPNAQCKVGNCYRDAIGVSKNELEAYAWYKEAADQGFAKAQHNIGCCYQNAIGVNKNDHEAFIWYQKAADQGYVKAQHNLGCCYQNGIGINKNDHEAFDCYMKAADQGLADAQHNVGVYYQSGTGVTKNDYEAFIWFQRSADQGFVPAQYGVGCCYHNGIGVTKNDHEAYFWYKKAAEQGHAMAQEELLKL